jgi:hypothetical protein
MDPAIQKVCINGKEVWQVESCGVVVAFHELFQATDFLEKLQRRVSAPHPIPEEVVRHWESTQAKWLLGEKH